MASNRHLGRIVALQTLYELELRERLGDDADSITAVVDRNLKKYDSDIGDKQFVRQLVINVAERFKDLDEALQPIAPDWPIDKISRIDRGILRIGLFELLHLAAEVPPKVVINEAVELAKSFGSDNSSKFINGVLGTAYRTLVEGQNDNAES